LDKTIDPQFGKRARNTAKTGLVSLALDLPCGRICQERQLHLGRA
jgi:hypothetical protein